MPLGVCVSVERKLHDSQNLVGRFQYIFWANTVPGMEVVLTKLVRWRKKKSEYTLLQEQPIVLQTSPFWSYPLLNVYLPALALEGLELSVIHLPN